MTLRRPFKPLTNNHSFRVRISRLRMKHGGADVHILPNRQPRNNIERHLREWSDLIMNDPDPPDAYAAIAFYVDPKAPGRPGYNVAYISDDHRLPTSLLIEMAGVYMRNDHIASIAKTRTMEALGWTQDPWPDPDDVA